jgi:hypothetical protein
MFDKKQSDKLVPQSIDYVTSAAKAVLGAIPFAGSLLAELAGIVIPNQRIDRIEKFAVTLEHRFSEFEKDFVQSQLRNESFTDLLEEGLRQASRSLSDERREYIANLVANSLSPKAIEYIESKQLLRLLGELNDAEIIWLKSHDFLMENQEEFLEKHRSVLEPVMAHMVDPPEVLDKEAIQKSYQDHLTQLGLLEIRYRFDRETSRPLYDAVGKPQVDKYEITWLGRTLLRYIGLPDARSG